MLQQEPHKQAPDHRVSSACSMIEGEKNDQSPAIDSTQSDYLHQSLETPKQQQQQADCSNGSVSSSAALFLGNKVTTCELENEIISSSSSSKHHDSSSSLASSLAQQHHQHHRHQQPFASNECPNEQLKQQQQQQQLYQFSNQKQHNNNNHHHNDDAMSTTEMSNSDWNLDQSDCRAAAADDDDAHLHRAPSSVEAARAATTFERTQPIGESSSTLLSTANAQEAPLEKLQPSPMDHDGCSSCEAGFSDGDQLEDSKNPQEEEEEEEEANKLPVAETHLNCNNESDESSQNLSTAGISQHYADNETEMEPVDSSEDSPHQLEQQQQSIIDDASGAESYLRSIWQALNVGLDGYLNIDELYLVCQYIGMCELNNDMIQQLFNTLDTDQDGRVGFDEFTQGLFKQQQQQQQQQQHLQMQQQQQQQQQHHQSQANQELAACSDDDDQYFPAQSSHDHYSAGSDIIINDNDDNNDEYRGDNVGSNINLDTVTSSTLPATSIGDQDDDDDSRMQLVQSSAQIDDMRSAHLTTSNGNNNNNNNNKYDTVHCRNSQLGSSYHHQPYANSITSSVAVATNGPTITTAISRSHQYNCVNANNLVSSPNSIASNHVIHEENENDVIIIDTNNDDDDDHHHHHHHHNCKTAAATSNTDKSTATTTPIVNNDCDHQSRHFGLNTPNNCNNIGQINSNSDNVSVASGCAAPAAPVVSTVAVASSSSLQQTKRQSSCQDNDDDYGLGDTVDSGRRGNKHHHSSSSELDYNQQQAFIGASANLQATNQQQQLTTTTTSGNSSSNDSATSSPTATAATTATTTTTAATTATINSTTGTTNRPRRSFGPTARAQRRHTLGMGIFGTGGGGASTTVWSVMSTNNDDNNTNTTRNKNDNNFTGLSSYNHHQRQKPPTATSFDRHRSNQSLEKLFDEQQAAFSSTLSSSSSSSSSANRNNQSHIGKANSCYDRQCSNSGSSGNRDHYSESIHVIDSNLMSSPMRVPSRMGSQRICYSSNDISQRHNFNNNNSRLDDQNEEEDDNDIMVLDTSHHHIINSFCNNSRMRNNQINDSLHHQQLESSNNTMHNSLVRNNRLLNSSGSSSSASGVTESDQSTVNPMIQFFKLDPNKRGAIDSKDIINYWESLGFYNASLVLKQLGYDTTYNRPINVENLSSRLEDELQMVSIQSRSEMFQLAMASLLQELTDLRLDREQLVEERDKLRENVSEANSRAAILATEIDEHHAKLEQASMSKIMQLEKKNQEQLRMLESQFVKEREQLQSQSLKLHNQMTNDLLSAQAQEIKSRSTIQQVELERNTIQMKLDEMIKLNHELKQQLHISELNQRKLEEMESNHNSVLESQQRSMSDQLNFLGQVNKKLKDENDELITELTNKDLQIQRLSGIIDLQKTPPESLKMETGHSIDHPHMIQVTKQQHQPVGHNHNQPLFARDNCENSNQQLRNNSNSSNKAAPGSENSNQVVTAISTIAAATTTAPTNNTVNSSLNLPSTANPSAATGPTSAATKKQQANSSRFKQRRNEHRGGRQGYRQRPA